jgi:Ulp1 family protease
LQKDINTLHGTHNNGLLTDEIVNFYIKLLEESSSDRTGPSVSVVNSFYFGHLKRKLEWSLVLPKHRLIIPINIEGNPGHWFTLCIDFLKAEIQIYDSLRTNYEEVVAIVKEKFQLNFRLKVSRFPKQKNAVDCGVFMCMAIRFLYLECENNLSFKHNDIPKIRKLMAEEIKLKRILSFKDNVV